MNEPKYKMKTRPKVLDLWLEKLAAGLPHVLAPEELDAWLAEPGRRAVWFHGPADGPAEVSLQAYRALPAEVRELLPLRMVVLYQMRVSEWRRIPLLHMSEIMVFEDGVLLSKELPMMGPGIQWEPWLRKWRG